MQEKLLEILKHTAEAEAVDWLENHLAQQKEGFAQRPFYYAFSGVSRHFDKQSTVTVNTEDEEALSKATPGFSVANWDEFRLARVILLLTLAEQGKDTFLETLNALINTADIREQVAIFSAFPLLQYPEELVPLAREGTRTNIVDVFDAIALDTPFPMRHFDDEGWNQMVLKALFISRPLYRVQGLETRANLKLAEALSNLAHERWAAGRYVSPELWRSCAPFLTEQIISDLARVAEDENPNQKAAVALIAANSDPDKKLAGLRDDVASQLDDAISGRLTWDTLGQDLEQALLAAAA